MLNMFNFLGIWQDIVNAVEDVITKFMFWIARMIYPLIVKFYDIFELIAKHKFITNEQIRSISNNVYALISVIMLFAFATKLLAAIVNPDLLGDKKKGVAGTFIRSIVAVVLVGVIPFAFNFVYEVQDQILEDKIVEKVILGQDGNKGQSAGELIAGFTLQTFLTPLYDVSDAKMNNENTDFRNMSEIEKVCTYYKAITPASYDSTLVYNNCVKALNGDVEGELSNGADIRAATLAYNPLMLIVFGEKNDDLTVVQPEFLKNACKETYFVVLNEPEMIDAFKNCIILRNSEDAKEPYLFDYNGLLAAIFGFFIAYEMFMYCIDIALRSVKLAMLQLIAPVIVCGYVFSSDILSKWLKEVVSTFILVFVKIAAISFMVYALTLLPGFLESSPDFEKYQFWIRLLVMIGLLQLIKQIPTIINTIFGTNIKDQGGLKGRLGEMAGVGQMAQKAWSSMGNKAKALAGTGLALAGRGALGTTKFAAKRVPGLAKGLGKGISWGGKKLVNTRAGRAVTGGVSSLAQKAANSRAGQAVRSAGGKVAGFGRRVGTNASGLAANLTAKLDKIALDKTGKNLKTNVSGVLDNLIGNARGIAKASGKAIAAGWKGSSIFGALSGANKAFRESPYFGAKKAIKDNAKRQNRSDDVAERYLYKRNEKPEDNNTDIYGRIKTLDGKRVSMKDYSDSAVNDSKILDVNTKDVVKNKINADAQSANIAKIQSDTMSLVESMKNYSQSMANRAQGDALMKAAINLESNGKVSDAIAKMSEIGIDNDQLFKNATGIQNAMMSYQSVFAKDGKTLTGNKFDENTSLGDVKREAEFAKSAATVADEGYDGVLKANASDVKVTHEMQLLVSNGSQFYGDALRDMKSAWNAAVQGPPTPPASSDDSGSGTPPSGGDSGNGTPPSNNQPQNNNGNNSTPPSGGDSGSGTPPSNNQPQNDGGNNNNNNNNNDGGNNGSSNGQNTNNNSQQPLDFSEVVNAIQQGTDKIVSSNSEVASTVSQSIADQTRKQTNISNKQTDDVVDAIKETKDKE